MAQRVVVVHGEDSAIENTVFDKTNSNPIAVAITDSDGTQITSFTSAATTDLDGGKVTVGTTAVELTITGTTSSFTITSDSDNTGKIWFGKSNVTNDGTNAIGLLTPGGSATITNYDDVTNSLYAVSDTAAQTVYKGACI